MNEQVDRSSGPAAWWEAAYAAGKTPFDCDAPLGWVEELFARGEIRGSVLDAGCGGGHNAIWLAERGHEVVGADISPTAIGRAREKAAARGVAVTFIAGDLCELAGFDGRFDTVVDIGCFHSVRGEEDRARYAAALRRACRPGARLHLRAFSDKNAPKAIGAHTAPRVPEAELRAAFARGWRIDALEGKQTTQVLHDPAAPMVVEAWFARLIAS